MRRHITLWTALLLILASTTQVDARRRPDQPSRFLRQFDHNLVQIDNTVDGSRVSAWAYRNGAEYDLALAVSRQPGVWSDPVFIGLDDGFDQVEPTLALDDAGTAYVAFTDHAAGGIRITTRRAGDTAWSAPVTVVPDGRTPALMVVGNTVVLAYRAGDAVGMTALPLRPPPASGGVSINSIYDGPDPTNGQSGEEDKNEFPNQDDPLVDDDAIIPFGSGSSSGSGSGSGTSGR